MNTPNIKRLIEVLVKERDPYIEWHDGPELYQVDQAVACLTDEERPRAAEIVANRLESGYDPYLGRAAELLGGARCLEAVNSALASAGDAYSASKIAKNLLVMGKPDEAVAVLTAIINDTGIDWSARIEALVQLKIALGDSVSVRPVKDYITPDLEAAISASVTDNDYLVRYHAAESLLRICGDESELSQQEELFALICGKKPFDAEPDDADREGFKNAVSMLLLKLKNINQLH